MVIYPLAMAFRTQTYDIVAVHPTLGVEHPTASSATAEEAIVGELAGRGFSHLSTKRTTVYRLGGVLKVRTVSKLVERRASVLDVRRVVGSPVGMLFSRRRRSLDQAWHAAKMELGVPVLLLDWAEDYTMIPASLERLHAAAADLPGDHPARALLLRATVVIERWLARWPATADPRAEDPDPRSVWNDEISLELQEIWGGVQLLLSGRG